MLLSSSFVLVGGADKHTVLIHACHLNAETCFPPRFYRCYCKFYWTVLWHVEPSWSLKFWRKCSSVWLPIRKKIRPILFGQPLRYVMIRNCTLRSSIFYFCRDVKMSYILSSGCIRWSRSNGQHIRGIQLSCQTCSNLADFQKVSTGIKPIPSVPGK